jgi:hypothetical protein
MRDQPRRPDVEDRPAERTLRCGTCGRWIDVCAFCRRVDCDHVVCYRCVRLAFRQSIAQPHLHGG